MLLLLWVQLLLPGRLLLAGGAPAIKRCSGPGKGGRGQVRMPLGTAAEAAVHHGGSSRTFPMCLWQPVHWEGGCWGCKGSCGGCGDSREGPGHAHRCPCMHAAVWLQRWLWALLGRCMASPCPVNAQPMLCAARRGRPQGVPGPGRTRVACMLPAGPHLATRDADAANSLPRPAGVSSEPVRPPLTLAGLQACNGRAGRPVSAPVPSGSGRWKRPSSGASNHTEQTMVPQGGC